MRIIHCNFYEMLPMHFNLRVPEKPQLYSTQQNSIPGLPQSIREPLTFETEVKKVCKFQTDGLLRYHMDSRLLDSMSRSNE